jgi:adenosylhomocysteine nucleosidase
VVGFWTGALVALSFRRHLNITMRILVTFAVEAEFAPWRKMRPFAPAKRGSVEAYTARFQDAEVIVLLTGVGGRRAWAEATSIIWDGNVDVCISSGLAGALRKQHRPGDVLVPREVHATSWDKVIPTDEALVELASQCGATVVHAFYSADRVIVRSDEKLDLGAKMDAVEMETGDILLEAVAFGARVVAIRGISDGADEALPLDFNRVLTEDGDVSIKRVLAQVAARPASLPALIRFGLQSRRAARKLALVLDKYVAAIAQLPALKASEQVVAR